MLDENFWVSEDTRDAFRNKIKISYISEFIMIFGFIHSYIDRCNCLVIDSTILFAVYNSPSYVSPYKCRFDCNEHPEPYDIPVP